MSDSALKHVPAEITFSGLKWLARFSSLASIGLLGLFLFGGEESMTPTLREAVAMVFFPFGVVAGMIIGWKYELRGGVVSVISLALFYAVMAIMGRGIPTAPWFVVFTLPGILFLTAGLLQKHRGEP
ncbi:MAG: hypothetical protein JNM43_08250 [Planctomycetaceae bacterium]|nr:hypothetical protein [Planctomycetaceae bacterium]